MANCFHKNHAAIVEHGAVTMSAGNAGRSFAYLCGRLGVPGTVCMPDTVPAANVAAINALGSDTHLVPGRDLLKAAATKVEEGRTLVHPFDDRDLIAGHASAGLEILEDCADADLVCVCCGGGGLVSGVAAAIKLSGSKARVIAVEPEGAPVISKSIELGRPASVMQDPPDWVADTVAHGLSPPFAGAICFEHCKAFVDDVVLVTDEELIEATKAMFALGFKVETSGCAGVAAVMSGKAFEGVEQRPEKIVCVVSGSNITTEELAALGI